MEIDYTKVDTDYAKIHQRLSELSEKYEIDCTLSPTPIVIGKGLPLEIRCFMAYRVLQNSNYTVSWMVDPSNFCYILDYYDKYDVPLVGRRIYIKWAEDCTWPKPPSLADSFYIEQELGESTSSYMTRVLEAYLKKIGYLVGDKKRKWYESFYRI